MIYLDQAKVLVGALRFAQERLAQVEKQRDELITERISRQVLAKAIRETPVSNVLRACWQYIKKIARKSCYRDGCVDWCAIEFEIDEYFEGENQNGKGRESAPES